MKNNTLKSVHLREHSNDEIYTPFSLSKSLLDHVPQLPKQSYFDPFYGTGSFFHNFPTSEKNDWCEINLGYDFFKYEKTHDWIISNPPFSQLTKTIQHTVKLATFGFAYILPSYALTHQRLKLINENGFYIHKLVHFKNPKSWQIGFQMIFVIFTTTKNPFFVNLESTNTIQPSLFEVLEDE